MGKAMAMKHKNPEMNEKEHKSPESFTEKEKWNGMNTTSRIQYLWDYYKLPLVVLCIFIYIISYMAYKHYTHKEPLLYASLINVAASESLTQQLSDGYLEHIGADTDRTSCTLYTGWYLTGDAASEYFEYTYATRMKVLASIDSEQLDIALMNQEAFDAFAQSGYLSNLEELLREYPDLYESVQPYLVMNLEILEDNSSELLLDSSLEYESTTTEYPMAVDLSKLGLMKHAGFQDSVYLGIIGNSPRMDAAAAYLRYLISE